MRRFKLFSLIQERVARRMCPSRWSARRRASWSASGGSVAAESLEPRCLLAAGDLDPSFGTGGKVSTSFGFNAIGRSAAIQSDGKIVVAGDNNSTFMLARYNNDGSLEGVVTTDFGTSEGSAVGIAVQTDGKVVVVGTIYNGANNDFALARYNINGSLDTTFDGDGMLTTDFAGLNDRATGLVIQPNGRIVVAGYADSVGDAFGNNHDFALVRYNSNGSLDTSFDGDGKLTTDFPTALGAIGVDFGYAIALQSDGKIVVAGITIPHFTRDDYDFALARYNTSGSLDTSFGGDGTVTTDFIAGNDIATNVVIQPDGKIVVAGYSDALGTSDFVLARYNKNGSLDTSFNFDGRATTGFGTADDVAASMALQSDGKIVVVGHSDYFGDQDFEVIRYNTDGSLDTSFSENGGALKDFGDSDDVAGSVVIQPNGRIIVAGYTTINGNTNFALARFDDASVSRLSITAANAVKPEGQSGSTPLTFTVNRTGDTSGPSSVQYSVIGSDPNPADKSDFGGVLPSGTVTFATGELSRIITVSVRGDTTVENDESFTVTLSNAVNADILAATAEGTILSDDASLAIAATDANQNEADSGNTTFTFTVTRNGDVGRTASVKYTVKGSGAATANAADFGGVAFPSGTLNFAVDETMKTITLNVRGDTTIEPDEGFTVTLSNPVNAILATATATGIILNDDASVSIAATSAKKAEGNSANTPFTFTVTRTGDARGSASVDFVIAGTATKGTDVADFDGGVLPSGTVNFSANETTKTMTINVVGDTTVEPNEGFTVALSNPSHAVIGTASATGTVLNDDTSLAIAAASANKAEGNSGNTAFTFTITRAGDVHSTASVQFAVSGSDVNSADAVDFGGALPSGVVTFTANQTSKTITVNVRGDTVVETDEGFTVTLSNATNAQIVAATATSTIKNDDTMLSLSPSNISQAEGNSGDTTFTFTVTRTGNLSRTASVKFIVTGTGTSPANAADFGGTFPSGTLNFAVNETTKTITIKVRGDSAVESDEGFKLTLSKPVNAMLDALAILATGTIQNDD